MDPALRLRTLLVACWMLGMLAVPVATSGAAEESRGREVFVAKQCNICHEERAVLQAPHLSRLRKDRTLFQLITDMWNHAPMMWANLPEPGLRWPRLSAAEMADLAVYLNGSAPKDPAPDRRRGQIVLTRKHCLACHTMGGQGAGLARESGHLPRLEQDAAWAAALWNHAPKMLAQTPEKKVEYPTIEWKELVDLIGFLRDGLRPR